MAVPRSEDEVQRFIAAQQQISDAINNHLGFRGYLMMMRLQRAANLRDLRDFLPDFAQALVKRIGPANAGQIVSAIERLISRRRLRHRSAPALARRSPPTSCFVLRRDARFAQARLYPARSVHPSAST